MLAVAQPASDAPTEALHRASVGAIRVGMPQLCRAGLSENWLWKTCGHHHWMALASAHGLDRPDFRNAAGERLYPAFTDVRLIDGRLDRVVEHQLLDFELTTLRTGRSRYQSTIHARVAGELVATMIVSSTFIRRAISGHNISAMSGQVARPSRLPPTIPQEPPFRAASWDEIFGFHRVTRREVDTIILDPSPHEDFNGADFLYCAAFQALGDRAEWALFRRTDPILTTTERRIVYTANIELGDRVRATLCGMRPGDGSLAHWIELTRESDGEQIAHIFTERRSCRHRDPGVSLS